MARHIQTSPATAIRAVHASVSPVVLPALHLLEVILDDASNTRVTVGFENPPAAGSDLKADWDALQEIHASSAGLRDSDGNVVTPQLWKFTYGTTFESLAENGFFNPLVAGSFEAWQEKIRFGSAFLTGNEFTRDADTKKVTAKVAHHIEPMASVAAGGVVQVDTSRWHAFKKAGLNEFGLTLQDRRGRGRIGGRPVYLSRDHGHAVVSQREPDRQSRLSHRT